MLANEMNYLSRPTDTKLKIRFQKTGFIKPGKVDVLCTFRSDDIPISRSRTVLGHYEKTNTLRALSIG